MNDHGGSGSCGSPRSDGPGRVNVVRPAGAQGAVVGLKHRFQSGTRGDAVERAGDAALHITRDHNVHAGLVAHQAHRLGQVHVAQIQADARVQPLLLAGVNALDQLTGDFGHGVRRFVGLLRPSDAGTQRQGQHGRYDSECQSHGVPFT